MTANRSPGYPFVNWLPRHMIVPLGIADPEGLVVVDFHIDDQRRYASRRARGPELVDGETGAHPTEGQQLARCGADLDP